MTAQRRMRSGGFSRGRGLRQRTDWVRFQDGSSTSVPAASKALLISSLALESEATIRRTILHLHISSDQSAASELQLGAVGAHIATDRAIAAGAASLLGPVTDRDDDSWFLWGPINQQLFVATAVGVEPMFGHVFVYDSKAQRRLQTGQGMVLMIENASSSDAFNVTLGISILVGAGLSGRR